MIKIAIIAPYPAAAVLPDECLKFRLRQAAKDQHPAPWVRSLTQELSAKSYMDIEVFVHSRHVARIQKIKKEGVKYTFVPKYEPLRTDPYHLHLLAMVQILPLIKKFNPDIVHGFGTESACGVLAVSQVKPSVIFIQGIQQKYAPYYDMPKLKIAIRKMLERYVVHHVDGFIAETDFAKRWALHSRRDVKVKVIPHAVTQSFFLGRPNFSRKRIVCIGTLSRLKGCTNVLKAFALGVKKAPEIFRDAELAFIGGGRMEAVLKSLSKDNGICTQICFLGRLPHEKILHEMEKACALVIGSRVDTSPNVVTEAHAAGLPVIGTNAGGIPDMIEDGRDGFIVPVDDPDAMSRRMALLLNDLPRCAEMGQAGRIKVRKLNDPSRIADAHIDFYKEILAGYSK